MKNRLVCLAVTLTLLLSSEAGLMAQYREGTQVSSENSSSVLKGLEAPSRPDAPWPTPDLRAFSERLRAERPQEIDTNKDYDLTELIDLAERVNPQTRFAWENARQAASAVGLAKSEYYPILALRATAAYAR